MSDSSQEMEIRRNMWRVLEACSDMATQIRPYWPARSENDARELAGLVKPCIDLFEGLHEAFSSCPGVVDILFDKLGDYEEAHTPLQAIQRILEWTMIIGEMASDLQAEVGGTGNTPLFSRLELLLGDELQERLRIKED